MTNSTKVSTATVVSKVLVQQYHERQSHIHGRMRHLFVAYAKARRKHYNVVRDGKMAECVGVCKETFLEYF
jgi:hypothetical protein